MHCRRVLGPGIPKTYAAEQKEDVYSYIAHALHAKERIGARQSNVEKHNQEDGYAHQGATVAGYLLQIAIHSLHLIIYIVAY